MAFTADDIRKIEREIIETTLPVFEKNEVSEDDLRQIATIVLDGIEGITTHEKMIELLEQLAQRWPMFLKLVTIEKGKMREDKKEGIVDDVMQLAKAGQIQQAISMAKTMTEGAQP
jgi:hypothetical protein